MKFETRSLINDWAQTAPFRQFGPESPQSDGTTLCTWSMDMQEHSDQVHMHLSRPHPHIYAAPVRKARCASVCYSCTCKQNENDA